MTVMLSCVVVGDGRVLCVDMDPSHNVAALKKEIKKEDPDLMPCDASELKLYLARDGDMWLNSKDPAYKVLRKGRLPRGINELMRDELELLDVYELTDEKCFGANFAPARRNIHVLVELPATHGALTRVVAIHSETRLERWRALNKILDWIESNNEKQKTTDGGDGDDDGDDRHSDDGGSDAGHSDDLSTGDSCLQWSDVKHVLAYDNYTQKRRSIRDPTALEDLVEMLTLTSNAMGDYYGASVARLHHFITPVLVTICSLFDDATLEVAQTVEGKNVHAHSYLDFVLSRGKTRICVVETQENDFLSQGRAELLVGCEVMADRDELRVVYGIVTNFSRWRLYRCDESSILADSASVRPKSDGLGVKSVRDVCEMIYGVLRNDDEEDDTRKTAFDGL